MTNHRETFRADFPQIVSFLEANGWSSFCLALLQQVDSKGELSDRQLDAVDRMAAKLADNAARKADEAQRQSANRATVDVSAIHRMFDKAKASGLNKLAYRAEGLTLSPASAAGKNPGAIYAKRISDGTYVGKIVGDQFLPAREASPVDRAALVTIAQNPADAATRYGQRTGTCSCCGRQLTNEESIARAIGPICAAKWGFA
jgi:hypothetical protein